MEPNKSVIKPLSIIGGIIVIIAGIIGYTNMGKTADTTAEQPATSTPSTTPTDTTTDKPAASAPSTPTNTTPTAAETKYKDGTYDAQGNYISPGGAETVGVKLTIKNDIVIDAVFTPEATLPASVNFQGQFAAGYKEFVIGMKLDDINVGKVSGSSLTPKGFNDAVAKIKVEAKA